MKKILENRFLKKILNREDKRKDGAPPGNPMLTVRLPMWRSKLVVFLLFAGFVALAARAFWIQGPGNAFYQKQGESRYQHTLELPAARGNILDRNGFMLATSLPARAIWAIPESVPDKLDAHKLATLGQLLGMTPGELHAKLSQEDKSFVYIKRQVALPVAAQVMALKIPGIYQRNEYRRSYPEGEPMANLIGFTNVEDEGQEGIELADQKILAGVPGIRRVIKDRMGHIVEDVDEQVVPHDGQNVELSIDKKIQFIAYTDLKAAVEKFHAKAGAAVVIDVRTGEVLALANYPSFNPNERANLTGEQLRNRILTDVFEPGSIMKPFTVSLALDLHRVAPTTRVDTGNGHFVLDGARITDDSANGVLTVGGVIQKSSNIGATKIAMTLKPEEMWDMYTSLGLGQAPKVGFPGAAAGRLRPWKHWRRIEQATMSYGYGLSASLFQLARAYTAIAHDGQLLPVTVFKTGDAPVTGPQVFSPTTAREVRAMLETVVAPGGTSPNATVPGYRVGGKSGTAYKHEGRGYDRSKYRASFIGMAPMPNPRIVVAVSVDEPTSGSHFGGTVSGPTFAAIAGDTLRTLNVAPDMPVQQLVVSDDGTGTGGATGTKRGGKNAATARRPAAGAGHPANRSGAARAATTKRPATGASGARNTAGSRAGAARPVVPKRGAGTTGARNASPARRLNVASDTSHRRAGVVQ